MKTRTLEERIRNRVAQYLKKGKLWGPKDHIRAELQRVARQVRRLEDVGAFVYKKDVLDLLKEATR